MKKMTNKTVVFAALLFALLIPGCDSGPQPPSTEKKTTEFETGRFALQKLIPSARLWSPDAQPIELQSTPTSESNGQGGKSANWRAVFGSPSRQKSEPFLWSGIAGSRHVDHGVEDTFNPNNRSTQTWDLNFLKTDTDKAYEVAQEHGGKQLVEKDPKTQISYLLEWNAQSNQLVWHVIYGGSESNSRLTVLVDATTGAYLRKE